MQQSHSYTYTACITLSSKNTELINECTITGKSRNHTQYILQCTIINAATAQLYIHTYLQTHACARQTLTSLTEYNQTSCDSFGPERFHGVHQQATVPTPSVSLFHAAMAGEWRSVSWAGLKMDEEEFFWTGEDNKQGIILWQWEKFYGMIEITQNANQTYKAKSSTLREVFTWLSSVSSKSSSSSCMEGKERIGHGVLMTAVLLHFPLTETIIGMGRRE